jgi:hypothetical protein
LRRDRYLGTWLAWLPCVIGGLLAGSCSREDATQRADDAAAASKAGQTKAAAALDLPAGQLFFGQRQHDFGEVSDVNPLVHAFEFENTGDARLSIQDVSTSCGCTAAVLQRREFEPGESDSIEVTWKPEGFGRQTKSVTILSNSEDEPSLKLEISASIQPHLVLTPARVQFGGVSRDEPHTAQVQLSTKDASLAIQSIRTSSPFLEAEISQPLDQGHGALRVTLREGAPWGMFMPQVEIEVRGRPDGAAEDVVYTRELSVSASLYNEVFLEPSFFTIGHVARGASFRSEIALSRRGDQPFQVTAEVSSSTMPGVRVDIVPLSGTPGASSAYQLVLSGQSGDYTGPLRGQVRLETDVPGDEAHGVAFMGVVR